MTAKMCIEDKNTNDIYQIYVDRLSLLEKSSLLPLRQRGKHLLEDKKEDMYVGLKFFKLKQNIKEQLGDMLTQLDHLEKLVNLDETE